MTDYSGLVERLREDYDCPGPDVLEHIREAAAAIEAQQRQLDKARAALEQEHKHMEAQTEIALRVIAERDALRAAVENHNAQIPNSPGLRITRLASELVIPLPPSAAPAASEPLSEKDAAEAAMIDEALSGKRRAEAGAGPKL